LGGEGALMAQWCGCNIARILLVMTALAAVPGLSRAIDTLPAAPGGGAAAVTIDKVYTFIPNIHLIGREASLIHAVSCSIFFPIVSNGGFPKFSGYVEAADEFDPENPPSVLSLHVFFSSLVPDPMASLYLICTATDDNDQVHRWNYFAPPMPIDKLPTNYTNTVTF